MRHLEGAYGKALTALGALGRFDFEWFDLLDPKLQAHLAEDLVAAGLASQDDFLDTPRFERWAGRYLAAHAEALGNQELVVLQKYVRWHMLVNDRLRTQLDRRPKRRWSGRCAELRYVVKLLLALRTRAKTLATCKAPDFEHFSTPGFAPKAAFIRWAKKHNYTQCKIQSRAQHMPLKTTGSKKRRELMKTLLGSPDVELRDRVSGLLIFLGFMGEQVRMIRCDDVEDNKHLSIRVGAARYAFREDISEIIRHYLARSSRDPDNPWLFPGRYSNSISHSRLMGRLRNLGMTMRPARNSFFLGAAQKLVWIVIALKALDLNVHNLHHWRNAVNGRGARYVANAGALLSLKRESRILRVSADH